MNTDWMEYAACKDADTNDFLDLEYPTRALRLCMECPVQESCARDAISAGDWLSIRGGMLPDRRKQWAKRHGIPRHGLASGYREGCRCGLCRMWMAGHQSKGAA